MGTARVRKYLNHHVGVDSRVEAVPTGKQSAGMKVNGLLSNVKFVFEVIVSNDEIDSLTQLIMIISV